MPDFKDEEEEYLPPKQFMWDIFNTLDSEMASNFVKFAIEQRSKEDEEGSKTVKIEKSVWEEIKKLKYFSKKKGKASHMLRTSKDFSKLGKKRKRKEMELYDPQKDPNFMDKRTLTHRSDNELISIPQKNQEIRSEGGDDRFVQRNPFLTKTPMKSPIKLMMPGNLQWKTVGEGNVPATPMKIEGESGDEEEKSNNQ